MFKVTVQADSFEELKEQLEPMFKMMNKFSKPSQPSAEDLGYSDDEEPSAPIQHGRIGDALPVRSQPSAAEMLIEREAVAIFNAPTPFAAPPVVVAPVVAEEDEGSVNTSAPDRDSRGIPWDGRIHASTRALKNDGTWKYRRNVDKSVIDQIEKGLTAPAVPVNIPAVPVTPAMPPLHVVPALPPTVAPVQAAPVAPVAAPPPVVQPARLAHTAATFQQGFVMVINHLTDQGKVDRAWLQNIAAHYNVPNWWDIAKYNDKCEEVFHNFVQWGFVTNVG